MRTEEEYISVKLCNQMIEALKASPDFEGEKQTRCVIYLDSQNPNPPVSILPGSLGALEIMEKIEAGEARLGDGYTATYGNFLSGDNDAGFAPILYVLQMISPELQDLAEKFEDVDEVVEKLEEVIDLLLEAMRGENDAG